MDKLILENSCYFNVYPYVSSVKINIPLKQKPHQSKSNQMYLIQNTKIHKINNKSNNIVTMTKDIKAH